MHQEKKRVDSFAAESADVDHPTLSLPEGVIRGTIRQTIYRDEYFSFEGIPYAAPPVGDRRFKAPEPPVPWYHIRDCTDFKAVPFQLNEETGSLEGTEDCLFINVYVKSLETAQYLPVFVFIYGGSFRNGGAVRDRLGPDYFMQEYVILVTFNYRLDSLGFLSLNDPACEVPGNAGLKDQVKALKWIHENIALFNGDNRNITLCGMSAGAASAHFMMSTNQTRGLFHKSILMSGSMLNFWACQRNRDYAYRLALYNGYEGENVDMQVLEFLQSLPAALLVNYHLLTEEEHYNLILFPFGPVIEPYETETCVIPKAPREMLQTAWGNRIPTIIGSTSSEGLLSYQFLKSQPENIKIFQSQPLRALPNNVREKSSAKINRKLAKKLVSLHFDKSHFQPDAILRHVDYFSYRLILHDLHRTILSRLSLASSTLTFRYRFDFDSPDFNFQRRKLVGTDLIRGVAHADELSYMFHCEKSRRLAQDSPEYLTIRRLIATWTSFANDSNPNCFELEPIFWAPLTEVDPFQVLNINHTLWIETMPEKAKLEAWNKLYKKKDLI